VRISLAALLAGIVFGAGLALADMTNPAKVQNFLDVFGSWDPSLAFVMGSALVVSALGSRVARRRRAPWLAATFRMPTRRDLDARLVAGASLFGVGWGLGGLCPGPALAGLLQGVPQVYLFVAAMAAGVLLHDLTVAASRQAHNKT
jgi:uncharacterized membrane protein YedE/YeeE